MRAVSLHPQTSVRPVVDPPWGTSNYQSFWVELLDDGIDRGDVLAALADAGVSARRGIMAAHLEPAYAGRRHAPLPVTERLTARSLILPLYHDMTAREQERVVDVLMGVSIRGMGAAACRR